MRKIWSVDKSWTVFLDRDGTINKHLEGKYIAEWKDFKFITGVAEAISIFNHLVGRVIIVTNQQGIGKQLMTHKQLRVIHDQMLIELAEWGARIDQIYYCPDLAITDPPCRKPNPGMGFQAREEFPEIKFRKSIMIGDQASDIGFGKKLQMKTVLIDNKSRSNTSLEEPLPDLALNSLEEFALLLLEQNPIT